MDTYVLQPHLFGKYKLFERLAADSVAETYKGKVRNSDGQEIQVMVKVILDRYAQDPKVLGWFMDEVHVNSMLSHPNILKMYDWGKCKENMFLVTEYLEGYNLASLMQATAEQGSRFPPTVGLYVICEVLKGLAYAHSLKDNFGNLLGVVHCDLCPSNILISLEGKVKLLDFSSAQMPTKFLKTRSGVQNHVVYLAPEQLRGQSVDARADLFSLGVILYELLTGRKLHSDGSEEGIDTILKSPKSNPLTNAFEDIPVELEELIGLVMAESPDLRPATAEELLGELTKFLERWDRQADANRLSMFLQDIRTGKPSGKQKKVGFAFGEATSQWMFRGENLEELVKTKQPKKQKDDSAGHLEKAMGSNFKPPQKKFSQGETVMAIQEGGLGRARKVRIVLGMGIVLIVAIVGIWWIFSNLAKKEDFNKSADKNHSFQEEKVQDNRNEPMIIEEKPKEQQRELLDKKPKKKRKKRNP